MAKIHALWDAGELTRSDLVAAARDAGVESPENLNDIDLQESVASFVETAVASPSISLVKSGPIKKVIAAIRRFFAKLFGSRQTGDMIMRDLLIGKKPGPSMPQSARHKELDELQERLSVGTGKIDPGTLPKGIVGMIQKRVPGWGGEMIAQEDPAAIRDPDTGKMWRGIAHYVAEARYAAETIGYDPSLIETPLDVTEDIRQAMTTGNMPKWLENPANDGFVLSDGTFVDRQTAALIARAIENIHADLMGRNRLASEELAEGRGTPIEYESTKEILTNEARPQQTRDRAGRDQSGSRAPLEGAPKIRDATRPDPKLNAVAEQYALDNGIDLRRQSEYVEIDEAFAGRVAEAYEAMEDRPQDADVVAAYRDLIDQTRAQYEALVGAGYSFKFYDETNDPYDGNPWNAMRDLRSNQRMFVFATDAGFGQEQEDAAPFHERHDLDVERLGQLDKVGVTCCFWFVQVGWVACIR